MSMPIVALATFLLIRFSLNIEPTSPQAPPNEVLIGPGFVKGQQSIRQLGFIIPEKWESDAAATKRYGLAAVLVPSGQTMSSAKIVITVAFQRKDPNNVGLDSLRELLSGGCRQCVEAIPGCSG
jgi:hypothetical protein